MIAVGKSGCEYCECYIYLFNALTTGATIVLSLLAANTNFDPSLKVKSRLTGVIILYIFSIVFIFFNIVVCACGIIVANVIVIAMIVANVIVMIVANVIVAKTVANMIVMIVANVIVAKIVAYVIVMIMANVIVIKTVVIAIVIIALKIVLQTVSKIAVKIAVKNEISLLR